MNHTVRPGTKPGYVEINFDGKPDESTMNELRAANFRPSKRNGKWHWWGKEDSLPDKYKESGNEPVTVSACAQVSQRVVVSEVQGEGSRTAQENRPVPGKTYALTGAKGTPAISNGATWAASEVKGDKPVGWIDQYTKEVKLTKTQRWHPGMADRFLMNTKWGDVEIKCVSTQNGLALCKEGEHYSVLHIGSGRGIGFKGGAYAFANAWFSGASAVTDWTRPLPEIMADKATIIALLAEVNRNVKSDFGKDTSTSESKEPTPVQAQAETPKPAPVVVPITSAPVKAQVQPAARKSALKSMDELIAEGEAALKAMGV